ncbi:Uncharacterised protein [uncultured archaeon]|nr:Uncharacterised protein [uncultured archaeon]
MKKAVLLILLLQLSFATIINLKPTHGQRQDIQEALIHGKYLSVYNISEYQDEDSISSSSYLATFFILDTSWKNPNTKIIGNNYPFTDRLLGLNEEFNNGSLHFEVIDIDQNSVTIQIYDKTEKLLANELTAYENKQKMILPVSTTIYNNNIPAPCKAKQTLFQQLADQYNKRYAKEIKANPNMKKLIIPWQLQAAIAWGESGCGVDGPKIKVCVTEPPLTIHNNYAVNKKTGKKYITSTDYGYDQINDVHFSSKNSQCPKNACQAAITNLNIRCGAQILYSGQRFAAQYVNTLTRNQIIQLELIRYNSISKALDCADNIASCPPKTIKGMLTVAKLKNNYALHVLCKIDSKLRNQITGENLDSQCAQYNNVKKTT